MEKSKLFVLLSTCTDSEKRAFLDFIQSPFFNKNQLLVEFYQLVLLFQSRFNRIPSKEEVFNKIYPKQAFKDIKVRLLMSDLFKLLEQFLCYNNRSQNELENKIELATIYRKRKLNKHFQSTIKQVLRLQNQQPLRDTEYFTRLYQIQSEE